MLVLSCQISCSYAVDARARVRLASGEEREFWVYYSRRYDPTKLQAALSREGWETVAHWAYGGDQNPCMLFLLRKSGPALRLVE